MHDESKVDSHDQTHIGWETYKWIALILFVITVFEVWVYYIPAFVATRYFVPVHPDPGRDQIRDRRRVLHAPQVR